MNDDFMQAFFACSASAHIPMSYDEPALDELLDPVAAYEDASEEVVEHIIVELWP